MPGRAKLGSRHGSAPPPQRRAWTACPSFATSPTTFPPTTSSSWAPAPAAWPPPCPRPGTARGCSSSTGTPARPPAPAPPASACARWRSSGPGGSPTPCASAPSRSTTTPPPAPPWSRRRARPAGPAATRTCGRSCGSAPPCRWSARRTWSSRSWPTPSGAHGGEIRFGARLVGLQVRPDGVRAELATGDRVRARFVVGADGTRSTVRAALGIGLRHLGTWAEAVQVLFRPDLAPLLSQDGVPRLPHLLTFVDQPQPARAVPDGRRALELCGAAVRRRASRRPARLDGDAAGRYRAARPGARSPRRGPVHPRRGRRHHLPVRAGLPRRRRGAPHDPGRRDRAEHRGPRRPRAGLEAGLGGPRPGRRGPARQPRRRARAGRVGRGASARSTSRAGRPTGWRATWATRTAPR